MSDTALSYYRRKYAEYSDLLKDIKKTQRILVFSRLVLFGMMVFVPLAFLGLSGLLAGGVFSLLLVAFLFMVKKSAALERKKRMTSLLLDINRQEIEAQRGNFSSFDDGSEFIDPDHQYSVDLDIFGPGSLFQFIGRCCTSIGKEKLAGMLLSPDTGTDAILKKQKAFRELAARGDLCQEYIATGRMFTDRRADMISLLEYVGSPARFGRNSLLVFLSAALPVLTLVVLAFVIAGILPFFALVMPVLVQLGITGALLKHINEIHSRVTSRLDTLKKYGRLLKIIENARFEAPLLKSVQRYLVTGGLPPSRHIDHLAGITGALDNRLNVVAALLLNGLFLWDLNCVILLERWNRRHRKQLPVWFDSMARMDACISFSVFTFNNQKFVFPVPVDEGPVIDSKNLGHPLITAGERVCNDFSIGHKGRFVIITGANMAGKSTFLRTAGVAMVLAMAGAPVCASDFRFRLMEVYTSMRTNDSLRKHESYFYAELKRLKHLIERIAEGRQVFVILDEILKGTNSADKQKGSAAIMELMISIGATGIIATHDLSLTSLEEKHPGLLENKCFEIEIENDRIFFDYILREGVTRKMNALLLMRQMGLLTREHLDNLETGG
jgi:hypothetical protein